MALIELSGAALGYEGAPVLKDVDARVARGDFVALVGPNGAGKTTFLRAVLGEIPPLSGRVAVDHAPRWAYVPQLDRRNLNWPLTVREGVELAVRSKRLFGRLRGEEELAIEKALARTGIEGIAGKLLRDVSGGQRQRAALAQALCQRPDVLVLDEPTQGLDVVAEKEVMDLLAALHAEGMTILFVTHALPLAMSYAAQILLFNAGALTQASPGELAKPGRLEAIYGVPFAYGEKDGVRWAGPAK